MEAHVPDLNIPQRAHVKRTLRIDTLRKVSLSRNAPTAYRAREPEHLEQQVIADYSKSAPCANVIPHLNELSGKEEDHFSVDQKQTSRLEKTIFNRKPPESYGHG